MYRYEHDGWRKFRTISVMYFVSFLIMTVFILCNLLTSVIIESYDFWNDIKVKAQEQTKLRNAQEKERMAKQTQAAATSGDADKSQSSEPRKSTMSSGIKLKATSLAPTPFVPCLAHTCLPTYLPTHS